MKPCLLYLMIMSLGLFQGCGLSDRVVEKARTLNKGHSAALALAKENRFLKGKVYQLEYEIGSLKSKNHYLQVKLDKLEKNPGEGRVIASIGPVDPHHDLVQFGTYKWSPNELLSVGDKEFKNRNYKKASQYYRTFLQKFPHDKKIDDELLFKAGLSSYESKIYHDWALSSFNRVISEHPNSEYFRGAKLWAAMTELDRGNDKKFFSTVEEFRKKYKNTPEWEILRNHYEKILRKYKR